MRRAISVPAEEVWRLISTFEHWPRWGPMVRRVESEQETVSGGATGRVATVFGPTLPFVIGNVEPGVYWDWRVGGVQATGHRVEALGSGKCEVSFTIPVVFYPYRLVLAWGLRLLRDVAESAAPPSPTDVIR